MDTNTDPRLTKEHLEQIERVREATRIYYETIASIGRSQSIAYALAGICGTEQAVVDHIKATAGVFDYANPPTAGMVGLAAPGQRRIA